MKCDTDNRWLEEQEIPNLRSLWIRLHFSDKVRVSLGTARCSRAKRDRSPPVTTKWQGRNVRNQTRMPGSLEPATDEVDLVSHEDPVRPL